MLLVAVLVALAAVAAGCIPEPPAEDPAPPPPPAITTLAVSTDPALFPAFSSDVTDYVVRCTGAPITVTVDAPDAQPIAVDGQTARVGHFQTTVTRSTGQRFEVLDTSANRAYHVRCLPLDFPTSTVTRSGATQAEYYLTAPVLFNDISYPTIFDDNGVPIWWSKNKQTSTFFERFANGNLAWTKGGTTPSQEVGLDAALAKAIAINLPTGATIDTHDLLRVERGSDVHYVFAYNIAKTGQDLTSIGGSTGATILDQVLIEVDGTGNVVWSWDTADHITIAETDPQWYADALTPVFGPPYADVFHWNSIEVTPTGFIVSYRHLNAVYAIAAASGDIEWKLGGSHTDESLDIVGDPVFATSHFGGQHDARLLADGSVTLYDDGSGLGRAPRGVRYAIDPTAGTATLVETSSDSGFAPTSPWGGSARRLDGGDWVLGIGGTGQFVEVNSTGTPVLRFQWALGAFVYRVVPVPFGTIDRAALRAGMDAQYG